MRPGRGGCNGMGRWLRLRGNIACAWRRKGRSRTATVASRTCAERAGQAGAHFSLIEENVAVGPTPAAIHDGWMHSPGHRTNLLNPEVDRVGIAVVASRGELYAVADYARECAALVAVAG